MRIGCCAYSYRDYLKTGEMDLFQFIDLAYELGLDGVELTSYFFESTDDEYVYSLKRHALKNGIAIPGAAVGNRFTQSEESERAAQVAQVKEWLDVSARLGASYLRIFAGAVPEGRSEDEAFNWVVDGIKECIPDAQAKGVLLALENHGGITTTVEQVMRIVDAVNSEWLTVNLDTGNYLKEPYREIAETVPRAATAHVKTEVKAVEGKVPVDTPRVLQTLADAGYRGFLNIEYEADEEAKSAVPKFIKELRECLKEIRV